MVKIDIKLERITSVKLNDVLPFIISVKTAGKYLKNLLRPNLHHKNIFVLCKNFLGLIRW